MGLQAQELRIGNWVKCFGESVQVDTISPNKVSYHKIRHDSRIDGSSLIEDFEPIPLSPEILAQCGAVLNNWYKWEVRAGNFSFTPLELSGASINKSYMIGLFFEGNFIGVLVPHLHQLQNLFFALCGTELNINL